MLLATSFTPPPTFSLATRGKARGRGRGGGEKTKESGVLIASPFLFGVRYFCILAYPDAAFNSASTTPPCPPEAAMCSADRPSCKDEGVSRQSGARMLYCCPYRESNTQIEEVGKNQGIRFTQPKIRTRILCICIICSY